MSNYDYTQEIERLRSRAKDNKATNAKEFAQLAESYLEKLRNTMMLTCLALIGYLGAVLQTLSLFSVIVLVCSITFAFISYYYSFRHTLEISRKYSEMEKNLSTAYISKADYEKALAEENKIQNMYASRINKLRGSEVVFIVLQFIFLMISLFSILYSQIC